MSTLTDDKLIDLLKSHVGEYSLDNEVIDVAQCSAARITDLRAQLDVEKTNSEHWFQQYRTVEADLAAEREMSEELVGYTYHNDECCYMQTFSGCDCGYRQLLDKYELRRK